MNPHLNNQHKSASIRIGPRLKKIIVAISGGFDPLHVGHIQLLEEAKKLGDELVVILNNDNWLQKKKRFCLYAPTRTQRNS